MTESWTLDSSRVEEDPRGEEVNDGVDGAKKSRGLAGVGMSGVWNAVRQAQPIRW